MKASASICCSCIPCSLNIEQSLRFERRSRSESFLHLLFLPTQHNFACKHHIHLTAKTNTNTQSIMSSALVPIIRNGLIGAATMLFTTEYVASWGAVNGRSMQPQFNNRFDETVRDIVVFHRFTSRMERGDIVVFSSPVDSKKCLIKRVIAMPGDQIRDLENNLVTIPDGHCWLEGDNSFHSRDSNCYGPIPLDNISGVVTHTVYPSFERMNPRLPESAEQRVISSNGFQRSVNSG